ncbi:hypothetical protein GBP46_09980 [Pediococcus acidilactici]|nr:hypothetical protein GBP46_09980 [Pediococcus acidilactici]
MQKPYNFWRVTPYISVETIKEKIKMKYTTVSARVPSGVSERSKKILSSKGISVSSAIRSMLIQITETGNVPFKI